MSLASRCTAMCNDELLLVDTITMRWERGTIRRPEIDRSEIIGLLERNERKGLYLSDWDREVLSALPPTHSSLAIQCPGGPGRP